MSALAREERTMAQDTVERTATALGRIEAALAGLRFGTVTAVVQDGVVVQVERTERIRLEKLDRHRTG